MHGTREGDDTPARFNTLQMFEMTSDTPSLEFFEIQFSFSGRIPSV